MQLPVIDAVYVRHCRTRFPLPSSEQVDAVEDRIGVTLPTEYRDYLLSYNGGYFNDPPLRYESPGFPKDALNVLYGIGASHRSAELASTDSLLIFEDNYPAEVLPIGYSTIGNLILLVTRDESYGSILIKRAYEDRCMEIASSIVELFEIIPK